MSNIQNAIAMKRFFLIGTFTALIISCSEKKQETLFELKSQKETGIDFTNQLQYDEEFNIYTYRNYYNGGGVSIGDINNDGLPDIYLTANLKSNKLYLNKGEFIFEDITEKAGVGGNRAWSTGVTMVDVNGDGLLDIYVCNSGDIKGDNKQNELFINNGDLTFTEAADKYNLDDRGYSTHASFFDYDKDGDLDAYILNNSYQAIGSFNLRRNERPKRDSLGGDKLMENVDGIFRDVSEKAGIYGSVIGFGLGVTVGDVNNDEWEDIYISNDFFERDYLYINQKDGTFKEDLTRQIKSISGASMGADLADVNNDGNNDLFVTEMLPKSNERIKKVTTFENWDRYKYNLENGYYHQFTRNTFQINNGNNTFSEVGRYAGVEASDWSWGALIFDMNNDGLKDIFIANGIYQDLTDQDYLQYISNEEVIKSIVTDNKVDYKKLIDIIPSNPVPNQAYLNQGGLAFREAGKETGLGAKSFSNGASYGDLDNDGDLDLVVNNVNMPSFVYENHTQKDPASNYIQFKLEGEGKNRFGIGAKITVYSDNNSYYVEQQPTRGFQSSVDFRPTIGLKSNDPVAVSVKWPSGKVTTLPSVEANRQVVLKESEAKNSAEGSVEAEHGRIFNKISSKGYPVIHEENEYIDFNRDRLLYHMKSTEGPKMSYTDLNGDNIPDFYLGGAKGIPGKILLSEGNTYSVFIPGDFKNDKGSEDLQSIFFDVDGDGDQDLYVCSGGTEFSTSSESLLDRLYINSDGEFSRSDQRLPTPEAYVSTSTVVANDYDNDGDQDLFVGERLIPFQYGVPTSGFILKNEEGKLVEVTSEVAPELKKIGMITDAAFADLDNDRQKELIIAGEYTGIISFRVENGKFVKNEVPELDNLKGWWNTIHVADLNNDGLPEIIAGNHGLNSRFEASVSQPITLYVNDFDKNGFQDPILTGYAEDGKEYPYALRHNLIDQIKSLKKKFPDYESYQYATIRDIFTESQLNSSVQLSVNQLASVIIWNNGNYEFEVSELPTQAQLSPVYAISTGDYDKDNDIDIILGGNLYGAKPEIGRYDASYGAFLENNGKREWKTSALNAGFILEGEVRDIKTLDDRIIVSRNKDSLAVFTY